MNWFLLAYFFFSQRRSKWLPLVVFALAVAAETASAEEGRRWNDPSAGPGQLKPKVGYFRDKNGIVTITNRLEKYQRRKDYVEIAIKYERIAVPEQYRRLDSASRYSAAGIANLVKRYARRYRLNANLIYAIIKVESDFNPYARSTKGACGLMQLMPATAAEMGVTNIFDPAQNIAGGTQYLAKLLKLFKNNLPQALAAYNAGPNVVKRHGGVPPYKETQNYVRDVTAYTRRFAREGVGTSYLARAYKGDRPYPTLSPKRPAKKYYTVHFNSGLTQPADDVTDEGPYYCIKFRNRVDLIRKEHVAKIVAPA